MTTHPNNIFSYLHCAQCVAEQPSDVSMVEWQRYSVGRTQRGLQVWCERHNLNVFELDFVDSTVRYASPISTLNDNDNDIGRCMCDSCNTSLRCDDGSAA